MIGRTISHYEIVEQIGDGGMGSVYRALDTKLQIHRALKFIHPQLVVDDVFKQRFILEAQAASSLDHPNICAIHQVDETPAGRPFICMTYYEGVTLNERLEEAPLEPPEVFQISYAVAQGLDCAHGHGVIHRDIKPSNIIITTEGNLKILDFGLAKLMGMTGVTKTGTTLGTVRYMAPEQAMGEEADHRADIWSLGLLMYEMATGTYPFAGEIDPAITYSIIHFDPQSPREINPELPQSYSDLIERCLAKDPARRYQTTAELINDLSGIAKAEGWDTMFGDPAVPLSHTGIRPAPVRRPYRWRGLATAGAVLAIAAILIWWFTRPPPLYTTDLRLAVMPLENRSHPARETLTVGLWEVITQMLDDASRRHDSMWVVPNRLVTYADIGDDARARRSFGVNRIITGGLQRFEGGEVLQLVLRDASSLEQLQTVRIIFTAEATDLAQKIRDGLGALTLLDGAILAARDPLLPDKGQAVADYLRGLGALLGENPVAAQDAFGAVTQSEPDFGMGWCGLGQAQWLEFVQRGDQAQFTAAVTNLERAAQKAPRLWQPRFALGEIQRQAGNTELALAALSAADSLSPRNPRIVGILARVLRHEDRLLEAEELLKDAIAAHPDYFENPRSLGTFYYWTDEEEASLVNYARALELAPDDAFSLNTVGAILVNRGDFDAALDYFERAFSILPNCETCSNIGLMLYYEEKFRESASYFELSFEHCDEDDAMIWANWARALYWTEGGRAESIDKFRRAIDLTWEQWQAAPGDPEMIGDLIEYHAMVGDVEATQRLIATGDSLASDNAALLYQIGDAYELIGDRGAALRYLGAAMRHGIPVEHIQETRELAELVADPRFVRMIPAASDGEDTEADSRH